MSTLDELTQVFYTKGETFKKDEIQQLVTTTVSGVKGIAYLETIPATPHFEGETWQVYSGSYGSTFANFGNINVPVMVGAQYVSNARFVWSSGAWNLQRELVTVPSVDLTPYTQNTTFTPVKTTVDGQSVITGPTPDSSFTTIPGTSTSCRWNFTRFATALPVLQISFWCVRAGTVSIVFIQDNGDGNVQLATTVTFTGCVLGLNTFNVATGDNPTGFTAFNAPANGFVGTNIATATLGAVGTKAVTNSSYTLTSSNITTTPVALPGSFSGNQLGLMITTGSVGVKTKVDGLLDVANPLVRSKSLAVTANVLNLFDPSAIIADKKLATTGIINSSSTGYGLAQVPVVAGQIVSFVALINGYTGFFSTVPAVSGSTGMIGTPTAIVAGVTYNYTVPAGALMMVISLYTPTTGTAVFAKFMVNTGATVKTYLPYVGPVVNAQVLSTPISAKMLEPGAVTPYSAVNEAPAQVGYVKNAFQERRKTFVTKRADGTLQTISVKTRRLPNGVLSTGLGANTNAWPQGKMCVDNVGRLYLGFNSASNHGVADAVCYTCYSDDQGQTWSTLKIVKPDPGTNTAGTDCWALGVDTNRKLYAIIRNRQTNNNRVSDGTFFELWTSVDFGVTWTLVNVITEVTQTVSSVAYYPEEFHDMECDGTYMYTGFHFGSNTVSSRVGILKISMASPTTRTTWDLVAHGGASGTWVEPTLTIDTVNSRIIGGFRQQSATAAQLYKCNLDGSGYAQFAVPSGISVQYSPLPVKIVGTNVVWFTIERFNTGEMWLHQMPYADFLTGTFTNIWSTLIGKIINTVVTGASENGVQDIAVIGTKVILGFSQQKDDNSSSVYVSNFDLGYSDNLLGYTDLFNMTVLPIV